ncbi:MAG: valine--tRNA ligase, partial [Candidatus Rokuibacteriota bacterium]
MSPIEPIADRYEPRAVEARWYPVWEEHGYFHARARSPKKPFCIVIPPPNVTGSLHMGHAFTMTLQDVLTRMKRMDGFNALWLPGTDHAGIATQYVVERQLAAEGKTKEDLGREAFLARVWKWKEDSGGTIIRQLKRLGASCDWQRERFTMDAGLSRAVREVFVRLWDERLIYRDDYIVNWCTRCRTVLSDLEVEREERDAEFVYIKYGPLTLGTVRPETKLGDTGLAVHPGDKRYAPYVGRTLTIPSVDGDITIRVVADNAVDPDFGTGVIKVTPGHDPVDFEIGRRHKLPIRTVIGFDGRMTAEAGKYAGLDRFECRARIVEDMKTLGLVEKIEPYRHAVGLCYRCKTVVEPLVSKQWYVNVRPLAKKAAAAARKGRIRIVPRGWAKTYHHWMDNIRPWCISRQLWWGHRIPAWYCERDGSVHVSRKDLTRCPTCGGPVRQDEDVLDTWFSSGLWPFSTLGWPDRTPELRTFYPTSVLVTGFDIIFFWVARMAMLGLHVMRREPFRDVYIHALVRDPEGQKMSKSKGNVIDPLEVMDRFGTDAFRFTLTALAAQGRDVRISDERVEGYRNFANKLWNAARLVLSTLDGYDPKAARRVAPGLPERWILSRLNAAVAATRSGLE